MDGTRRRRHRSDRRRSPRSTRCLRPTCSLRRLDGTWRCHRGGTCRHRSAASSNRTRACSLRLSFGRASRPRTFRSSSRASSSPSRACMRCLRACRAARTRGSSSRARARRGRCSIRRVSRTPRHVLCTSSSASTRRPRIAASSTRSTWSTSRRARGMRTCASRRRRRRSSAPALHRAAATKARRRGLRRRCPRPWPSARRARRPHGHTPARATSPRPRSPAPASASWQTHREAKACAALERIELEHLLRAHEVALVAHHPRAFEIEAQARRA